MRATQGFDLVRKLAVASAVTLLATSAVAGGVLAGNTSKLVYFGSGPTGSGVFPPGTTFNYNPTNGNYNLLFTPVTGGQVTSVYVTIQNKGGGTLNHVILEGGDNAPDPMTNTNFIPDNTHGSPPICTGTPLTCIPSLPSLPTGFKYIQAFAPLGRPCTISATGRDIKCEVGQVPNNVAVTYRLAIQVPAFAESPASNDYQTWFTASGNEGTSNQGSNQDAFFALGTIRVDQPTCSDANFFTSGIVTDLETLNCDQPAKLAGGAFVTTGAFARVAVSTDPALCLTGYKCFGKRVEANVEFGAPVTGGLKWTVMWQKSSLNGTPKGSIHFLDAYPTDPKLYEIIDFKSTAQCPDPIVATTKLPCLNGKPGFVTLGGISYFRAVFTTTGNGQVRGF